MRYALSWVVSICQWGVIIMMMQGEGVFQYFQMTPPSFYYRLQEKKWMVLIGAFLLGNQLSSMATNTGAFEVYCDGELLFSKLSTGQMPDVRYLAGLIKKL
jgi:selT/selW/selH-like putative selenoprotein